MSQAAVRYNITRLSPLSSVHHHGVWSTILVGLEPLMHGIPVRYSTDRVKSEWHFGDDDIVMFVTSIKGSVSVNIII